MTIHQWGDRICRWSPLSGQGGTDHALEEVPGLLGGCGRVCADSGTCAGKGQCRCLRVVQRQIVVSTLCHAGVGGAGRGGVAESAGTASREGPQLVPVIVYRAVQFYFGKGIVGATMRGRGGGMQNCVAV